MSIFKRVSNLRATFTLARSMKRIADALEEQNNIRKTELRELHDIIIPDLTRKWAKEERETEVIYGEQPVSEEDEWSANV